MKIKDFLCLDAVTSDLKAKNKEELIDELVALLVHHTVDKHLPAPASRHISIQNSVATTL